MHLCACAHTYDQQNQLPNVMLVVVAGHFVRPLLCKYYILFYFFRYNCKPKEYLIECNVRRKDHLDHAIRLEIQSTLEFLKEHRYDPSEIYDGELLQELQSVPDPAEEPLKIINDFADVFETMGNTSFLLFRSNFIILRIFSNSSFFKILL